jgi:cation transport protein ChaC
MEDSLAHWDRQTDLWVFGYGSLVWRPEFDFTEQRVALSHGYHRALCLWSRVNRGTPERPGLVFGLDVGGSCRGMAFRIPAGDVLDTMQALWRREMPSGAYIPKWLSCRTRQGMIQALAFVMNRNTDAYVRDLSRPQVVEIVRGAHGCYGPCVEYVLETARALRLTGIHDKQLEAIVRELQGTQPGNE